MAKKIAVPAKAVKKSNVVCPMCEDPIEADDATKVVDGEVHHAEGCAPAAERQKSVTKITKKPAEPVEEEVEEEEEDEKQ